MDGFHKEEMVFVIGTTNFVESLDPALMRPGRFEFHLHIPYPDHEARREIIKIYDKKMRLKMSEDALEYTVKRTGFGRTTNTGTPFSGDHLNAICRAIARLRLREKWTRETTPEDVERAMTEFDEKLILTPREERLCATHEAGHAVVSLFCPYHPPIERITIQSEMSWAAAYVQYRRDDDRRLGLTRNQMFDDLTVLLGGIEAERLLLDDVSTGAMGSDLERATGVAHFMVEMCGMGATETGLRQFRSLENWQRHPGLSDEQAAALDRQVTALILEAQQRAATILKENRVILEALRDMLLEKKTIDAKSLKDFFKGKPIPEKEVEAHDPVETAT
jgi:cell division protease FtsH